MRWYFKEYTKFDWLVHVVIVGLLGLIGYEVGLLLR